MKNFLVVLLLLSLPPGGHAQNPDGAPRKAIVAGKVAGFDRNNPSITIYVDRLWGDPEDISVPLDGQGRFRTEIGTYTPADLRIRGRLAFRAVVQPGDSLHVVFDGGTGSPEKLLSGIEFSGGGAGFNRDIARFQLLYQPMWADWQEQDSALYYGVEPYLAFVDTLEIRRKEIFDRFIAENNPGREARLWAELFLKEQYWVQDYLSYPARHRAYTRQAPALPADYYEPFAKDFNRVDEAMFINTKAVAALVGNYLMYRVLPQLTAEHPEAQSLSPEEVSALIYSYAAGRIEDPVLREIALADILYREFQRYVVSNYEKNRERIDRDITSPWLRTPIRETYAAIRLKIDNPQFHPEARVQDVSGLSAAEILDHIRADNRGKAVYVDFWASWCGPCLEEMPGSKALMEGLKGSEAAFVFIAIDDEKQPWDITMTELQLPGRHYLLDKSQSTEMRELLGIQGIPFYVLMDKQGGITDKGSSAPMRPRAVKPRIEALLK